MSEVTQAAQLEMQYRAALMEAGYQRGLIEGARLGLERAMTAAESALYDMQELDTRAFLAVKAIRALDPEAIVKGEG